MLLLTSPSDQVQIITDTAASIDVHASWVDITPLTSAIAASRLNTIITTAATTSVAGSPPASTQRNVKALHVRNKHATQTCQVTIQLFDGSVVTPLYVAPLAPGNMLEMTDFGGIRRA
jgi:hypothetical protein